MESENPKYTVHYFELYVRAEAIRMLLSHANIPFKNRTISFAEWGEVKKNEMNGS